MHDLFPREVTSNVPHIALTGDELLEVEQHKGLISCGPEVICLRTATGLLRVNGEGLHFRRYSAEAAVIAGRISGLTVLPDGRRG